MPTPPRAETSCTTGMTKTVHLQPKRPQGVSTAGVHRYVLRTMHGEWGSKWSDCPAGGGAIRTCAPCSLSLAHCKLVKMGRAHFTVAVLGCLTHSGVSGLIVGLMFQGFHSQEKQTQLGSTVSLLVWWADGLLVTWYRSLASLPMARCSAASRWLDERLIFQCKNIPIPTDSRKRQEGWGT